MDRGYFALWRKFKKHPFWKERRIFSKAEAWIDLLWSAQYEDDPRDVLLGSSLLTQYYGECLKSNVTWGQRWGWSESKVRRFFKLLKKMKQIDLKNEGITTRITILNYAEYDPRRRASDEQATSKRRDRDETATTKEEGKEGKEDNICQKPILEIPLKSQNGNGPETHIVYQSDIDEWQKDFQLVDVKQTLVIIKQWNISNVAKRKSRKGIRRHITNWLSKEQEKQSKCGMIRGIDDFIGKKPTGTDPSKNPYLKDDDELKQQSIL